MCLRNTESRLLRWNAIAHLASLGLLVCSSAARPAGASDLAHARATSRLRATHSITHAEVNDHVATLADDRFEGRDAGSRGGRAAAGYLLEHIKKSELIPAGDNKTFFQSFSPGYRNVLAMLPGTDPELQQELVICSAHYDHVGYGTRETSRGPLGWIHNGADDNASGVSAVLEVLEAFRAAEIRPARTILFAFWDGEEKGLLGSRYWLAHRTLPDHKIVAVFNIDMIGRLTAQQLEVHGSRTAFSWRQRIVELNPETSPLKLRFPWKLEDNSDHFPFFQAGIPVLMFHTGLHKDYHTPHDDVDLINADGLHQVAQLAFGVVEDLANDTGPIPQFRPESQQEQQEPTWLATNELPPRLGLSWEKVASDAALNADPAPADPQFLVRRVVPSSPAGLAGLRVGDRLLAVNQTAIVDSGQLLQVIADAPGTLELTWKSASSPQPITRTIELEGAPVRLGIAWKRDRAEPHTLIVSAVRPGSAAQRSGIRPLDRIHRVNGQAPDADDIVLEAIQLQERLVLDLEREGQLVTSVVELPARDSASTVATRVDIPAVQ